MIGFTNDDLSSMSLTERHLRFFSLCNVIMNLLLFFTPTHCVSFTLVNLKDALIIMKWNVLRFLFMLCLIVVIVSNYGECRVSVNRNQRWRHLRQQHAAHYSQPNQGSTTSTSEKISSSLHLHIFPKFYFIVSIFYSRHTFACMWGSLFSWKNLLSTVKWEIIKIIKRNNAFVERRKRQRESAEESNSAKLISLCELGKEKKSFFPFGVLKLQNRMPKSCELSDVTLRVGEEA